MNSTPSSEISVYFDAPTTHMSTPPASEPAHPDPLVESPVPHVAATPEPAALAETTPAPESSIPPPAPATPDPVPETEAERAESSDVVDPNGVPERKSSPVSPNGHGRAASLGYAPSVSRRSVFTNGDGQTISGSTFINGAGTTGPNATAEHNDSLHQRAASADAALTEEQKSRITKNGGVCLRGSYACSD